jgi:hypothetical protein
MHETIQHLVRYIVACIEAGEFESALDKNGKPFARVQPEVWDFEAPGRGTEVRSASVYVRKNGCVQLLANLGGFNNRTEKKWARSTNVTIKPINEFASIVIENGKMKLVVEREQFDSLIQRLS